MVASTLSIDRFLDREPSKEYNCLDFVTEVWEYLFHDETAKRLKRLCRAAHEGRIGHGLIEGFQRIARPCSPCIVLFKRDREREQPHVGIYLDGKVLHMFDGGAEHQTLNVIGLRFIFEVRFYK